MWRDSQFIKKFCCIFLFLFWKICSSNAQQWVWDEISKEDEGGPFSGIFGTILLFGVIWLLGRIFGGKDKDNNSSHHTNDEDKYFVNRYLDNERFD
mgnify:FL=1